MSERQEVGEDLHGYDSEEGYAGYGDEGYEEAPPDPWVRRLSFVAGLLVVAILAVVAYGVWYATQRFQGPRTATERRLKLAEAQYQAKPKDFGVLLNLGRAQIAAGKLSDAEKTLKEAGKLEPDQASVYSALGDVQLGRGNRGVALQLYLKGLALVDKVPKSVQAQMRAKGVRLPKDYHQQSANGIAYAAALLYREQKDLDRAEEMLVSAVHFDPQDSTAWTVLGDVRAEKGDKADAEKAYREALRFVPDYAPALDGLKKIGVKP